MEGYFFNNSKCQECTKNCKHCLKEGEGSKCAICNPGYARNTEYNCIKCDTVIQDCEECYFSKIEQETWISSKLHKFKEILNNESN